MDSVNCAWNNVDTALDELRKYGSIDASDYIEAVASCAVTLGALQSNHSAIVGPMAFDVPGKLQRSSSGRQLQLDLGRRRKAACIALSERAVAKAGGLGLIGQNDDRARTLATLVRVTVGIVAPSHPFLQEVNGRIQNGLKSTGAVKERTLYGDRTIGADLGLVLATGRAPVMSTVDLARLGWTDIEDAAELLRVCELESYGQLKWEEVHYRYRTLALGTARKVVALQQDSKLLPPAQLQETFATLGRLITAVRARMQVVLTFSAPKPVCSQELGMLHLPLVLEGALLRQAKRHAKPRSTALWEAQQRRFLRFLGSIVEKASCDMKKPETLHLGGALLELLEVVPGWMGMLFEGVKQFEEGRGPLMGAGVMRETLVK